MNNTMLQIQEVQGLKPEIVNDLQTSFSPLFQQAKEWEMKASEITVDSVDDVEMMKRAREARLMLKKIRTETETIRKSLKEESLLKGKAIDGMANIIKYLIVPIETRLEEQEKFAEKQEELRLQELANERGSKLNAYQVDYSAYDLKNMQDSAFEMLLESSKIIYEKKQEDIRKENEARIEAEKKEREEQERVRKENEELKVEAQKREIELEKERKIAEEKARKEKKAHDAEIAKAQEAKDKAEKELQEQRAKEARQKQVDEQKAKEEQDRLKALALAPDKDKLRVLAGDLLKIEYPNLTTTEGKKILEDVRTLMKKVNVYIVENIDKL